MRDSGKSPALGRSRRVLLALSAQFIVAARVLLRFAIDNASSELLASPWG